MSGEPGELLPTVEIGSEAATASVIWLHGLGADGNDFAPIVPELGLASEVRFVFPHAPARPVTINGGYVMRAWYDIRTVQIDAEEDEAGIRASAAQVETLIARERERGVPDRRIVLAGFSQGGAIALHTGLRHSPALAGILALSTYLPLPDRLSPEAAPAAADVPILMCHGSADTIVPVELAERSRARLMEAGYAVEWRSYPMPHSVCPEEVADIATWLRRVLSAG